MFSLLSMTPFSGHNVNVMRIDDKELTDWAVGCIVPNNNQGN